MLLIPENKSLQEIRVSIDRLEIQGKMVGLIRLV